jgi:hypothetical protein
LLQAPDAALEILTEDHSRAIGERNLVGSSDTG